jgi:hypothetical protein
VDLSKIEGYEPGVDALCPKEIAPLIGGVSARTAQRLMASGAIKSFRPGPGKWLLRAWPKAVEKYLEEIREAPFRGAWSQKKAAQPTDTKSTT